MLQTIEFDGILTAKSLLEGIAFAKRLGKMSRAEWGLPPRGFIPKTWLPLIFPNSSKGIDGDFDRSKYLVCLIQQLEKALKRGDVLFLPVWFY